MSTLAPVLMVQGTSSSAGKSTLVAGLCRLMARRGVRVAPFKAQNMSNNAAVCPGEEGGEIGRAQYVQALAAGIQPTVDMNPILLKPQDGASQVILRGRVHGVMGAREYFASRREQFWPVVEDALGHLRQRYEMVVAEGAGSPAEINLRDRDIVNMRVALHANADVLIVGDIDAGGVFASLLGTWEWLEPRERALVRGFLLNKFRGDLALLEPAPLLLEQRTGVPVLGVVPFLDNLGLADEDAAVVAAPTRAEPLVEVGVVRLPHLSNFDEFGPLSREPRVQVRYVQRPEQLRAPDLIVVPGSKATIPDLLWLHESGLAERIRWLATSGTPVLGICGGFQMLGTEVTDPDGLESSLNRASGVSLIGVSTVLGGEKRLRQVAGRWCAEVGFWGALNGVRVGGYEIHVGDTSGHGDSALLDLGAEYDGAVAANGSIAGTYVHGLFEESLPRQRLVSALAERRGFTWRPETSPEVDPFERLADVLEGQLRVVQLVEQVLRRRA